MRIFMSSLLCISLTACGFWNKSPSHPPQATPTPQVKPDTPAHVPASNSKAEAAPADAKPHTKSEAEPGAAKTLPIKPADAAKNPPVEANSVVINKSQKPVIPPENTVCSYSKPEFFSLDLAGLGEALFKCMRTSDKAGFNNVLRRLGQDYFPGVEKNDEKALSQQAQFFMSLYEEETNYNLAMVAVESGEELFLNTFQVWVLPFEARQVFWSVEDPSSLGKKHTASGFFSAYDLARFSSAASVKNVIRQWELWLPLFTAAYYGDIAFIDEKLRRRHWRTGESFATLLKETYTPDVASLPVDFATLAQKKWIPQSVTLLHVAAWQGHAVLVEYLLENGADVNAVDGQGWTPLDYAHSHGSGWAWRFAEPEDRYSKTVDKLLLYGAKTAEVSPLADAP